MEYQTKDIDETAFQYQTKLEKSGEFVTAPIQNKVYFARPDENSIQNWQPEDARRQSVNFKGNLLIDSSIDED